MDLTHLVDEIREKRLSRNRCFALMSRGPYRAAMHLGRYLDGLARQILEMHDLGALELWVHRPAPGQVRLRMVTRHLQVVRHCHLSEEELECLCRHHPTVRPLVMNATLEEEGSAALRGGSAR